MTDPRIDDPQPASDPGGTGVQRPDQQGDPGPAQRPAQPATGGDGAAGEGGPDGFGTGT